MPCLSLRETDQYACRSGGALFQSIAYVLIFFVCAIALARVSVRSLRQSVLLLASIFLYLTWTRWFAAVLFLSILMNFLLGKWLRRNPSAAPLWTGIVLNLGLLAAFKYLPELSLPFSSLRAFTHLALPLGISFWTFQALSYLFDLYRGEELDPTLVEFALYMAFFPVTISGPVCRMPEMLPQFRSEQKTEWGAIVEGFRRIALGALMMQIAKLLGQGILAGDGIVSGFDRATHWTGADVWCLAIGYGLQLFFDFAGYSHIAIGAAKALGIDVPENFQRPLASTSPAIFWTRWHMSLSFWIRDYVFFPLAVLRREIWWRHVVLILSMVLFGLWHRASVLFLLWGAYHGVLLVSHRLVQQVERRLNWQADEKLWNLLSWITTLALVSLGWIFFRANSWSQAKQMLSAIGSPLGYGSHALSASLYLLVLALALGYAIVVLVSDALSRQAERPQDTAEAISAVARWRWFWIAPLYVLAMIFVLVITWTQSGGVGQFMYRGF
jgi:alginate O-acetyltransferase complex protein AlgI